MAAILDAQLLYKDYDKGLTEEPVRQCSLDFLSALLADFTAIKWDYLVGESGNGHINALILQAILVECDRLRKHEGLFPDEATKKQFLSAVCRHAKDIFDITSMLENSEESLTTGSEDNAGNPKAPWDSFLARDAAGSGLRVRVTSSNAIVQVIPEPGLKLLELWHKENKSVVAIAKKWAQLKKPKNPVNPAALDGFKLSADVYPRNSTGVRINVTPVVFRLPVRKPSSFPKATTTKESPSALCEALARVLRYRRNTPHRNRFITMLVTRWRGGTIIPPIEYTA